MEELGQVLRFDLATPLFGEFAGRVRRRRHKGFSSVGGRNRKVKGTLPFTIGGAPPVKLNNFIESKGKKLMPISPECQPRVNITRVKYQDRNFSHDLFRIEWIVPQPKSCPPLTEFRLRVRIIRKHGCTDNGPLTVPGMAHTAVVEVRRNVIDGDVASFRA